MKITFHIKEKNLDEVKSIIKEIEDIEKDLSNIKVDIEVEIP
jgi:hypothetical protein